MGDWMDQPLHSLSTSAIHQVKSVKKLALFLGHDGERIGGLEGPWENLHAFLQTYFPLATKGLLQLDRNRRAILLVPKYMVGTFTSFPNSNISSSIFFLNYFSSPQVPCTDLQKQVILSSNEKQPPLGTKPTAVLWPQGNIMH